MCEAGTYTANSGQGECAPCPHPLSSANGSATCAVCLSGFYMFDPTADPAVIFGSPGFHCRPETIQTMFVPRQLVGSGANPH